MYTANFPIIKEVFRAIKGEDPFDIQMDLKNCNVVIFCYDDKIWKCNGINLSIIQIIGENNTYRIKMIKENMLIEVDSITFGAKFGNEFVKFNVTESITNIKEISFTKYIGVLISKDMTF